MLEKLLRWPRQDDGENDAHAHPGVDMEPEAEVGWIEDDAWDPEDEDEWLHDDGDEGVDAEPESTPTKMASARMTRRVRRRMAEEQSLMSQYAHPRTVAEEDLRSEVARAQQCGDLRKVSA